MQNIDAWSLDALFASGRVDEARASLEQAILDTPGDVAPLRRLGKLLAAIGRLADARAMLQRALALAPNDVEALWGVYELEQVLGNPDEALGMQRRALALAPVLSCEAVLRRPSGRRTAPFTQRCSVLMLCVPGTYQANNPLEYIVDGESIALHKWFLLNDETPELPAYDVVFNAIGYAHGVEAALARAQRFITSQTKPAINSPVHIPLTSRAAVTHRFADSRFVVSAPTVRVRRNELSRLQVHQPMLVRPLNSQAGTDLCKIACTAELASYLTALPEIDEFYQSPFIEYASGDGLYRKYRIAFIDGQPYPVHLAISSHWMVHYYNSAMADHRWMRDEEAAFMCAIGGVFSGTAGEGLREIANAFPLEYFAIDCSIAPDGRLLLFEADTAMIVHMGDPIEIYPYKHRYMPRIIDALDAMFLRALGERTPAASRRLRQN